MILPMHNGSQLDGRQKARGLQQQICTGATAKAWTTCQLQKDSQGYQRLYYFDVLVKNGQVLSFPHGLQDEGDVDALPQALGSQTQKQHSVYLLVPQAIPSSDAMRAPAS